MQTRRGKQQIRASIQPLGGRRYHFQVRNSSQPAARSSSNANGRQQRRRDAKVDGHGRRKNRRQSEKEEFRRLDHLLRHFARRRCRIYSLQKNEKRIWRLFSQKSCQVRYFFIYYFIFL